ncbi:uncharacterized protein LOC102701364 [Oryza brachyantha]|uniref:Uncharacterized protein n=1 Tax=Oryza brachyantha TaxID=4533 RepID=J3MD39_ORYBR|nr:uncharacterized protein LOC102701364 [Oryza brachyantha]
MAGRRLCGGSDGDSVGPSPSDGSIEGMARNRRVILGLMYGYYEEALNALPLGRMPALARRLLHAGVCFGLADPVTNIIANTLRFVPDDESGDPATRPESDGARKRKRKRGARGARGQVLSKIVAGDGPYPPEAPTIAERSLEGLTTFLTSYYRYLPTWDGLRYLCLARADLLAAVRLIEADRCHRRRDGFHIRSHAVHAALRCAALSARLPNVDAFLTASAVLASPLTLIHTGNAPRHRRLSIQDVTRLSGLLEEPPNLNSSSNPMDAAATRCHHYDMKKKAAPTLRPSLWGLLLDRIHAAYLKAISRMPMRDFRSCYHHGLLRAGYCYGPFDPISNIIVNTIWYDTAFPAPEAYELDMICTPVLVRIESRSLVGLISLMLVCVSGLSEHEAMVYLLKSDLELPRAIQMAGHNGCDTSSWDATAYKAAADASYHPEVEAYVQFAMESLPMVRSAVTELLSTRTLSSSKIRNLCKLLSSSMNYPYKSLEPADELTEDALKMASSYKENYFSEQNFVRKKVEATLQSYEQAKEQYELRFICTVNKCVGRKSFRDSKHPYSHVNFWASAKHGANLTLFFAQVSNDDEDKQDDWSFCQPVLSLSTNARCCYCEFQGTRILHPIQSYCGGAMDFEKMALGTHTMDNEGIISHGKLIACGVGICGEDYIYFDPARDVKFIQAFNRSAWAAKLNWGDEIRRIKDSEKKKKLGEPDEVKKDHTANVSILMSW